ncbi:MAG: prepilin-type N-terminal cleavage/methylation domain-containing protein [Casimicrobiaceae bacterium]
MTRPRRRRQHGFTLVELLVALTLLALIAAVLFGSLRLAGRSWEGGENKVREVGDMRQTETFLRRQIAGALPKRMVKAVDTPLLFAGGADELRYVAALPERVVEGGTMFFRLLLVRDGGQLVLERMVPDPDIVQLPDFTDAERTVLADGIGELKLRYFGRNPDAPETETPTWRDRWDDPQRLPLLIRIIVQPTRGPAWPELVVEPRRAPEAGCRQWDSARNRCARV